MALSVCPVELSAGTNGKADKAGTSFASDSKVKNHKKSKWDKYFTGNVNFIVASPEAKGTELYNNMITDPKTYIQDAAREVLNTLYFSPKDSIPYIKEIKYILKDYDGISAKSGNGDFIQIAYSTRWVEKTFENGGADKLDYETKGVLYHELTHAYQLEPQQCGSYGDGGPFWTLIEGMADAVRVANGCFTDKDRPKGGNYMDGYRTTGFFFCWIMNNKDKDFLKKLNRTTLEVIPWSFEGAFKKIFGKNEKYKIENLWKEYQIAVGDIKE